MRSSFKENAIILGIVGVGVAILALFFAIVGALIGWPIGMAMLYPLVQPYQEQLWFQFTGTVICIIAAWLMFWLRNSTRRIYAVIELVCAINLMWYGVSHQKTPEIFGATLLAGIYVAVRGLDNWKQGTRDDGREKAVFRSARSHADAIQMEVQKLIEENRQRENMPDVSDIPRWGPTTDLAIERLEVQITEDGPEFVVSGTVNMPEHR